MKDRIMESIGAEKEGGCWHYREFSKGCWGSLNAELCAFCKVRYLLRFVGVVHRGRDQNSRD